MLGQVRGWGDRASVGIQPYEFRWFIRARVWTWWLVQVGELEFEIWILFSKCRMGVVMHTLRIFYLFIHYELDQVFNYNIVEQTSLYMQN